MFPFFLTVYPTNRSSFLLYSSCLSAMLHSFTSLLHPEKSVPQAQQAFLFSAEASEVVHTYHADDNLGTDCTLPSAAFLNNQKYTECYFSVSVKCLSTYSTEFAQLSPATVPSNLCSVCFPQMLFALSQF